MSNKSDQFRRMVRKAVEKSGGNLEVAMRRAQMCLADPATMQGALEALFEPIAKEVLSADPDLSEEDAATKILAIANTKILAIAKARAEAFEREPEVDYRKFHSFDLALGFAAADVHPDWEHADGKLRYKGKRSGQNPMKLIDWFCTNYPQRVAEIKRQFS
jgi:hypothetical protein